MTVITTVLMIEQAMSETDLDLVTALHGDEEMSYIVLMQPRGDQDRLLRALDDVALGEFAEAVREGDEPTGDEPLGPAEQGLRETLAALRDSGADAVGQLVPDRPLDTLASVVEQTHADEVIVLTAPAYLEELFHRDWASRARHKVGVPVLRLFSHAD